MRRWIKLGFGVVVVLASGQACMAAAAPLSEAQLQAAVRMQAISARCQKALPGLTPQLLHAHDTVLSRLDVAQSQAVAAYAESREGKKLAKATRSEAADAFGRNVLAAAETCMGLLKDYEVAYPEPAGTAMPADKVRWQLEKFAPMVLASLKCARLDGIDVEAEPATGEETWTYRGCDRSEVVHLRPTGRVWSMDDATADRLFAAMVD